MSKEIDYSGDFSDLLSIFHSMSDLRKNATYAYLNNNEEESSNEKS